MRAVAPQVVVESEPRGEYPSAVPLCLGSTIRRGEARQETVFGRKLVLWRGASGRLGVLPDACPHKGFALSRSSVEKGGDGIVCGYHGSKYSPDAACTPTLGGLRIDSQACYTVTEKGGVVWVGGEGLYLSGHLEIPFVEHFNAQGYRTIMGQKDLSASFTDLHDNTVDVRHLPTVHGRRMFMTEIPMPEFVDKFTQAFDYGMAKANPFLPFFQGRGSKVTVRDHPPYCARVSIESPNGPNAVHLFLDAVPVFEPPLGLAEPKTRIIWRVARNFAKGPSSDHLLRLAVNWTILEDGDVVEGIRAARDVTTPHDDALMLRMRDTAGPWLE